MHVGMPRDRRLSARAVPALLAFISLSACTKTLDTGGLEDQLKAKVAARVHASVASVACPSNVAVNQGATFRCTATLGGGDELTLEVTQTDGSGTVTWSVASAAKPPATPGG